jgi:hypothetical protein
MCRQRHLRFHFSLALAQNGDLYTRGSALANGAPLKIPDQFYTRALPGGGYVSVESRRETDSRLVHLLLLVERRSDPIRRIGHEPPVIADVVDGDLQRAVDSLIEIATNNVEVARALQRWQSKPGGR